MDRQCGGNRKFCVILDKEQMELAEKLLTFLGEAETGDSGEKIIERAVRSFTDEKSRYIAKRYNIDVRSSTLTELRQYRRDTRVDIAARDTVILPVPENPENRKMVLEQYRWHVPGPEGTKMRGLRYAAVYWRSPTWALTHYAKIISMEPSEDGGTVIILDRPEPLPEPVCPREPENRLRRPRYTTLSLVLEAKILEELL